ncbi:MAG: DEAD/DEAH box helicase [Deltaproteobacteria bacterium]|nr:DEAD/DEAH box helicase [Deltaproteobacteria bacterium]
MKDKMPENISQGSRVKAYGFHHLGIGEVLQVRASGDSYQVDVAFEGKEGRILETIPIERLEKVPDLFERLSSGDVDTPLDFYLKQLAYQLPLHNAGGELSNSRTDLLPHQILLTKDIVEAERRKYLIADEVGLGKTIETGLIIRELIARKEAERILIISPAGLTKNWQQELRDCFRLHFDILGIDFNDTSPLSWENHHRVIASIDTIKQTKRIERIKRAPKWDMIVFDEAHHLSRKKYGSKVNYTLNFRLAETLRNYTRDMIFLTATPHQGDPFQFWSLIQLLDDQLFESPDSMLDHRGLLNRVMFRRTKREATDAEGKPIFMRRQVHTQAFPMAAKERWFYERLTEYLREGYGIAGVGEKKTTSRQRAVGFVMATFQKMMSSSPRAIRQALRRRLLVLLALEQMTLEKKIQKSHSAGFAERILKIQDEMRALAVEIASIPPSAEQTALADSHIAKVKQRIARKGYPAEEPTPWALDAEDEAENVIYLEAVIPDESQKVRDLIKIAPEGTDRKFDTLMRAIEQVRRLSPQEKIVIFTQYRETLEFLKDELGKLYGEEKIAVLKGGPLEDKIAAVESFWEPDGAQFLVSTSAGGEGINLQVCHILFNYDLPWNPMAVEQRIGRIHRYGQTDTVQVYNLVAEDTVEERIYGLLEAKLLEIARTIGKVDKVTGEVTEDFRSEILGFLGSSPDYQELYKKALIDKNYKRTEAEIVEAILRAKKASETLRDLAQDLESFNFGRYRNMKGPFTLDELKLFVERGILRLGGTFIPKGDVFYIETPEALHRYSNISPRYENVVFDRKLAMRKRKAELFGLGHPLVDALIEHLRGPGLSGEVTIDKALSGKAYISVRCIFVLNFEQGVRKVFYKGFNLNQDGELESFQPRHDIESLYAPKNRYFKYGKEMATAVIPDWLKERIASIISEEEARLGAKFEDILSMNSKVVGLVLSGV